MARWLTNPTRNHGIVDSIPGLTQWVKDPAGVAMGCGVDELPYAASAALKKQNKKKQKNKKKKQKNTLIVACLENTEDPKTKWKLPVIPFPRNNPFGLF